MLLLLLLLEALLPSKLLLLQYTLLLLLLCTLLLSDTPLETPSIRLAISSAEPPVSMQMAEFRELLLLLLLSSTGTPLNREGIDDARAANVCCPCSISSCRPAAAA